VWQELRLIFPGSQRLNRGSYEFSQLMDACRANSVTDFLVVHEHRGVPDGLIVCHLPHGPTAYFTLSDIVMRHDIPDICELRIFLCRHRVETSKTNMLH
jgi:U3 small nucleolar ribonucleoprotein protein IMP4